MRYDTLIWRFLKCCTATLRYNSRSNRSQQTSYQRDDDENRGNKPFLIYELHHILVMARYDMRKTLDFAYRTVRLSDAPEPGHCRLARRRRCSDMMESSEGGARWGENDGVG